MMKKLQINLKVIKIFHKFTSFLNFKVVLWRHWKKCLLNEKKTDRAKRCL